MSTQRICALVVTYNRRELLLECLDHLFDQDLEGLSTAFSYDILVVDNASSDGTREALSSAIEQGRITYINTGANLGGAGGFNYGMREAVERGYDYVWAMDDDCMAHRDTLREFLIAAVSLDGDFGFLSSVCRWTDGSLFQMNKQRYPLYHTIEDFSLPLQPCAVASFVSLFVPVSVIREVGLPISEFFIWTDDWEYTRRISRVHDSYLVGTSVVTHKCPANDIGNVAHASHDRIERFRYAYRNEVMLYRREGVQGYVYVGIRDLNHLVRIFFEARDKRWERIRTVLGGTWEGLRFHPAIEQVDALDPADSRRTDDGCGVAHQACKNEKAHENNKAYENNKAHENNKTY